MSDENTNVDNTESQSFSTEQETSNLNTDWKSSLSEGLRGDTSLTDIKDIESLAKGYVHAQKELGGRVRIPTEEASPEAREAFYKQLESVSGVARIDSEDKSDLYNKLGRPETVEGYKISEVDGVSMDDARLSRYAEAAHKAGLTNEQFDSLVRVQAEEAKAQGEAFEASRIAGESKLKEMWGQDYDNRLAGAQAAADVYAEKYPEAMEQLMNSEAANNPAVLSMFSELHTALQESGAINPSSQSQSYGLTPNEAQDMINEIRSNKSHPYHNHRDPSHKAAVDKMQKLYNAISGQ